MDKRTARNAQPPRKPSAGQLIRKYNDYYLKNPNKWAGVPRNEFMFDTLGEIIETPNTVIDVGCGVGHTLEYLASRWPMAELHGMDLSPVAIKLTERRVPKAITHTGFLENLKPGQFDLVICLGTAEHFEDLLQGLQLLKGLIAPGGHLYLEVPHNLLYSPGTTGFRQLETRSRQWEWHLERPAWEAMLHEAGLKIDLTCVGKNEAWEFVWVLS